MGLSGCEDLPSRMLHVSLLQGSCCSSSPWRTSWALYLVYVLYYYAFIIPYEIITPDSPKRTEDYRMMTA